ncbi:hypothetical protein JB92DRAFT_3003819, partial [Gautieria morchelliformis]
IRVVPLLMASHCPLTISFRCQNAIAITSSSSSDTHWHHLTPLNSMGLDKNGDIKTGGRKAAFNAVELDTRTGRKVWRVCV